VRVGVQVLNVTLQNFRQSPKIYFNLPKDPTLSLRPARQSFTPPDPPTLFWPRGYPPPPPLSSSVGWRAKPFSYIFWSGWAGR
jgi:hypothetical protein